MKLEDAVALSNEFLLLVDECYEDDFFSSVVSITSAIKREKKGEYSFCATISPEISTEKGFVNTFTIRIDNLSGTLSKTEKELKVIFKHSVTEFYKSLGYDVE